MRKRAEERSAADFLPKRGDLQALREAAEGCRGCDLYKWATQTVFGEGPPSAKIVMIGEQPGDREDKQGHPFVGPAGGLLDRALEIAKIDRSEVYVTNAVKHFKWKGAATAGDEPMKKRRIHDKPKAGEIRACRPWLEAEIAAIEPDLLICLGASATAAVLGPKIKVTKDRGKILQLPGLLPALVTVHPSAILRMQTSEERHEALDALVADLRVAARFIHQRPPKVRAAPPSKGKTPKARSPSSISQSRVR
jgi:uracil-DNA glycosylase